MIEFFKRLFNSSDFMPHGHCYLWHTDVLWLNVIGDGFIALAYYSIPFLLWWIVRKRKDLPFNSVFLMFALFILACGTTHVMEIVNIWDPQYRVSGMIKGITALASIGTAAMLYTMVPAIMAIPSPAILQDANRKLQETNERLQREIDERRRTEQALMEREEKLRYFYTMVDNASDAVIMTDEEFRITSWNKGAQKIFGYTEEEVQGKRSPEVLQTEIANGMMHDRIAETLRRVGVWQGEVSQQRKDGSRVPLLSSKSMVVNDDGTPRGFIALNHDITERREAERRLGETMQALKRSNADLQQFAFVASHDLKEPLRKIQTFSDRIADTESRNLTERGRDYFGRMQSAAARMESLIDDLLTYAGTTDNGHARSDVNLNALLDEVRNDLHSIIESSNAQVTASELPIIHGVPVQLRQLFQNLISNAIKFRKPDVPPVITIDCSVAERSAGRTLYALRFSDNGIGFAHVDTDRIFNLFHRLHGREQYSGTGIGLAVCKRVAENHGGNISATGREGEGATFEVLLADRS